VAWLAISAPVALLSWQRGGVDPAAYTVVFGTVLTVAGLLLWLAPRLDVNISLPWPVAVVALLPILQLAPLGTARTLLWRSWREDLYQAFAALGVQASSSITLYPLATLRAAVVLAGCCALFVLARAVARRRGEAVVGVVAALLALAAGEAILGLGQSLGAIALPGTAIDSRWPARGTFANRNHFSVLLEAGFCLALGLAAFLGGRGHSYFPERSTHRLASLASQLAAGLCLAGVAASGSRMGIAVVSAVALAGAFALPRSTKQRFSLLPAGLLTILLLAVLSLPNRAQGFANLLREGGDPGRAAIWSDALTAAGRHFPAGSGLGTFAFAFRRSAPYFPRQTVDHAHCDWLEFLVELGLAGALFLAGSIGLTLFRCCRRPRGDSSDPLDPIRVACLLGTGAILLHSSVDFPLQIPALAALFSALLGCAAGLASRGRTPGAAAPMGGRLGALGCWSLAFAAATVYAGKPPSWDAEALYGRGQRELLSGRAAAADLVFRRSLEANPYSAAVWQKRAEAARMSGEENNEIEPLELASRLEPFTFRTDWPVAQALLRRQRWEQASQRLRRLAETLPDLRPAIFRAALQAGMPPASIAAGVVPEDAAGAWLRLLADREAWAAFGQTLLQWDGARELAAAPQDLRYVFDRLFQRRQNFLMKDLWQAVSGERYSEPFALRSPPAKAHAGARDPFSPIRWLVSEISIAGVGRSGAAGFAPNRDSFAFGFGFQWVSQPAPGVLLHIREASPAGRYLELDFRAPSTRESVPLSHYFAATPEAEFMLEAQVMTPNTASGEVRLEIWSAGRLLGSSPPIRRFESWRSIEVPFQTEAGEEVLQLRVVSKPAPRKQLRGRFFLGTIRARPAHDDARRSSPESIEHAGE
jgi:tetratricopeptide (TPR) repeat protein